MRVLATLRVERKFVLKIFYFTEKILKIEKVVYSSCVGIFSYKEISTAYKFLCRYGYQCHVSQSDTNFGVLATTRYLLF